LNGPARTDKPASAALAQLNEQADALRSELALLRSELVTARQEAVDISGTTLRDANEQLVLAALEADALADTATFKLHELTRSSQRDALTGTPNRALMLDRLQHAIALGLRHQTHVAVIFLDVDNFKAINDTLGHAAGDEVLKLVARRLEGVVRASDTVSRHSGDEFLMLLADVSHSSAVEAIAAKVLDGLSAPALIGGSEIALSASIGIAMFPEDGDDPATLIALADQAMYRSKNRQRGTFAFHSGVTEAEDGIARPAIDPRRRRAAEREVTPARQQPGVLQLREANENLVIAALTAQALEEKAVDAQRRQAQLLAIVAHELRSPLAPIRAAADLLKHAGTNAALLEKAEAIIKRQVTHISKLVGDLLDGSRVSAGKFRLEPRTVELADILGWAVQTCQEAVDRRRQRLTLRLPSPPLLLDGDPMYLVQIFGNLLDNASKYTPESGDISISAVALGHSLAITVADNGLGIAPETLPKIFELYAQGVRASAHNVTGLGVGLAVVRDLVHAHGGTVVGRSAGAHLGSEFIVTLPCAKREAGGANGVK
jgi:diguanylate cyclase (GGDEF)-like protein